MRGRHSEAAANMLGWRRRSFPKTRHESGCTLTHLSPLVSTMRCKAAPRYPKSARTACARQQTTKGFVTEYDYEQEQEQRRHSGPWHSSSAVSRPPPRATRPAPPCMADKYRRLAEAKRRVLGRSAHSGTFLTPGRESAAVFRRKAGDRLPRSAPCARTRNAARPAQPWPLRTAAP